MRLHLVAFCALLAAPAYAEDRVDPSGATDSETLRGNVLVWADATFYTSTEDGAQAVHAQLGGARKDRLGGAIAMHVVSVTKDGYVEVEAAREPDCGGAHLDTTDDLTRVRWFVQRGDLAPVLTQPFTQTFDDGTHVELRPGVAVIPTTDDHYVFGVHGGAIAAAVPAASVGHAYTPDHAKASPTVMTRDYVLAPNTRATLGDHALQLDGARATSILRHGDTTLFSIRTRCASLEVAVPTKAVREVEDDDDGDEDGDSGLSVLELRDHDFIPPGTVLSTTTGHPVAVAQKPIYLPGSPHGKTACVDRRVRVSLPGGDVLESSDDKLRVCAPTAAVVHERMRSAISANGTTRR